MKIGVIAEETNDVDVLYQLTCKLIDESIFSFKQFVGHGCGKLRRKCSAWAANLLKRGCTFLVVIHDLDDYVLQDLHKELSDAIADTPYTASVVLIPVRAIEAWLLTDSKAIQEVFSLSKQPKLPGNPEAVLDPKKELTGIVWNRDKKRYVNTIHNKKIAQAMNITKAKRCKSFRPYPAFVSKYLMD